MSDEHEHSHEHDHTHPHAQPREPGAFIGVIPILNVGNVAASLGYYRDQLGFEILWTWPDGEPPTFAEIQRGKCHLMLAQQEQGGPGMWVSVEVAAPAGLDALYLEYQRSGARIAAAPEDKPWGMREMLVHDLDGHTLRLGAVRHED